MWLILAIVQREMSVKESRDGIREWRTRSGILSARTCAKHPMSNSHVSLETVICHAWGKNKETMLCLFGMFGTHSFSESGNRVANLQTTCASPKAKD